MTTESAGKAPERGALHEALDVFAGQWKATGMSYGGTEQSGADPRANGVPWTSEHTGRWHTGQFFLVRLPLCDRVAVRVDG